MVHLTAKSMDILRVFATTPKKEFYIKEISKLLGISPDTSKRVLDNLAREGVLTKRQSGQQIYFRINPKSRIAINLIELIYSEKSEELEKTHKIIRDYHTSCENAVKNIVTMIIFGSYSQGKERNGSDVDILLIVKDSEDIKETIKKTDQIKISLRHTYGTSVNTTIVTEKMFRTGTPTNTLYQEVLKYGIPLIGVTKFIDYKVS